jgi:hypothetical protein
MTNVWRALALSALLLGAGCATAADDPPPSPAPMTAAPATVALRSCAETYREGQPVNGVDDLQRPCHNPLTGLDEINGATAKVCPDGRMLVHSNNGWAFVGEGLHLYPAGAELVPPRAVYDPCYGRG